MYCWPPGASGPSLCLLSAKGALKQHVGCRCPGFWQLGGCRGVLCENRTGAAPHHTQFQLAAAHPPQGIAQPHSHDSGSSGKVYLGKVKDTVQLLWERERKMWDNQCCRHPGQKRRGRGAPSARSEIPCSPRRPWWCRLSSWSSWMTSPLRRQPCPERAHIGAGPWQELQPGIGDPCWSNILKIVLHGEDPCCSSCWRTVSHGRVPMLE